MVLAILALIFTLISVLGLHEGGHALAAYFFKVKIKVISIGFGKPLFQWRTKKGCLWVWAMWPLGGYVQLLNSRITKVEAKDHNVCFDKKPVWVRVLILLAGPFANFLTAWLFFTLVFYVGIHYKVPLIQSLQNPSIASAAGITPGAQFISIGTHLTPSWQEVGAQLVILWGSKNIPVRLQQADGQFKEVTLNLSQIKFNTLHSSLLSVLGIKPDFKAKEGFFKASSLFGAAQQSFHKIGELLYFFSMVFKQLFSGLIPFSALLGPIGLFAVSVASLQQGIVVFLFFIATFSVAVAVVNLIPLPGLDGGSILYGAVELLRGKPLPVAVEVLLYRLMFIGFCLFLVQLSINDWLRFMATQ